MNLQGSSPPSLLLCQVTILHGRKQESLSNLIDRCSGQLPTSDQKKQEAKDYGNKATEWACASCHLSPLWFSTATRETDVLLETTGSWAAGLSGDALSGQDPLVSNVLNQKPVTLSSSSGFTHMVQSYPHKGPQSPPHLSRLLQTPSLQSSK